MRLVAVVLSCALVLAIAWILFFGPRRAVITHPAATAGTPAPGTPAATSPGAAGPATRTPAARPPATAPGGAPARSGCLADPHSCGFPDATDSGVPPRLRLRAVPGQVSSGPGWAYDPTDHEVDVTGNGAVLTGLSIRDPVNVTASGVTIADDRIVTGGFWGVRFGDVAGITIENSTVSGQNPGRGRVGAAICDVSGRSTGAVISGNNITYFKTAVQVPSGLITGNYIHGFGYLPGDHSNGVFVNGTTRPAVIYHNTILDRRPQTDAISLDASSSGTTVANKIVEGNLLAGGSFTLYGGAARGDTTSGIVVENNWFGRGYFPAGGRFGPVAYFDQHAAGNVWRGNAWAGSGQPVPLPAG
jgi:hypothetical protein